MIVTYPGRYGDLLWSLPAARELAQRFGPVDYKIGGPYASLVPLLEFQPYIASAEAIPEWTSPDVIVPRHWPGPTMHLGEETPTGRIGTNWSIPLVDNVIARAGLLGWSHHPFLFAPIAVPTVRPVITAGFSDYCQVEASVLLQRVQQAVGDAADVIRLETLPWLEAASVLNGAILHLGCRSALNVVAHGLGKPVVTWEPCAERRHPIFGYPYGREVLTTTMDDAIYAVRRQVFG